MAPKVKKTVRNPRNKQFRCVNCPSVMKSIGALTSHYLEFCNVTYKQARFGLFNGPKSGESVQLHQGKVRLSYKEGKPGVGAGTLKDWICEHCVGIGFRKKRNYIAHKFSNKCKGYSGELRVRVPVLNVQLESWQCEKCLKPSGSFSSRREYVAHQQSKQCQGYRGELRVKLPWIKIRRISTAVELDTNSILS